MELRLVCRAGTLSACARINLILSLMFFVPLQLYALFCSEIVAHTLTHAHTYTRAQVLLWRAALTCEGGGCGVEGGGTPILLIYTA